MDFFSPKTGGDSEGVENLTSYTRLTSCRTFLEIEPGSLCSPYPVHPLIPLIMVQTVTQSGNGLTMMFLK